MRLGFPQRLSLVVLFVAYGMGLGLLSPPAGMAQTQGAFVSKSPAGPDGTARGHIGDTIVTAITVQNIEDESDTVTVTSVIDTVSHGTGLMTSTNLLNSPVILDPPTRFGGTSAVTVTLSYSVLPGDENLPDHILQDHIRVDMTANHDGPSGSHVPDDFYVILPGQIVVLQPCLQITNERPSALADNGFVNCLGSVSNCGNTLLTNVVVSNLVDGAFNYLIGPLCLETNQAITFTNSYVATDPCQPKIATLCVWGTDGLGLALSNMLTISCSPVSTNLPVFDCPPDKVVECGAEWAFGVPTATDLCDGTNVSLVIVATTTNLDGLCEKCFSATRTWRATDSLLNSSTCAQTITVVDTTPPELVCGGDQTVECGTAWAFALPTATDACDGPNLRIVEIGTSTNMPGPGENTLRATRTSQASDSSGNLSICSQNFAVRAATNPNPMVAPRLGLAQRLPTGEVQCQLSGEPCQLYEVQTSSNLLDWISLTNFLGLDSQIQFQDSTAQNASARFYRAVNR